MLYQTLEFGLVYDLLQKLFGAKAAREYFIANYACPQPGQSVLDIGCGPGSMLPYLPHVDYIGIDANPMYIQRAKKYFSQRGTFLCNSVSTPVDLGSSSFDIAIGFGILHHLSDEETYPLFQLAFNALKPGGRFVTMDTCYSDGQPFIAYWMSRLDRGKFVRTLQSYAALARRVFPRVQTFDYCGELLLPCNHVVLVCEKP